MPFPDNDSAIDDLLEVDLGATALPFTVKDVLGHPTARSIELVGGGNLTLTMPNGQSRTYTGLPNPWSVRLKYTAVQAVTIATKVRIGI